MISAHDVLSGKGSLSCHTCCDMMPQVSRLHPIDGSKFCCFSTTSNGYEVPC